MKRSTMGVLAGFSLAAIIFLLYVGVYAYSASMVKVRNITVNEIESISLEGFTLGGEIEVYNDGFVTVGIDHITYEIVLDYANETVASGIIKGGKVAPGSTMNVKFSNKITWVPTADLALRLLTPEGTDARISGTIYLVNYDLLDIHIPFETHTDIEPYITQFINEKASSIMQKIGDVLGLN